MISRYLQQPSPMNPAARGMGRPSAMGQANAMGMPGARVQSQPMRGLQRPAPAAAPPKKDNGMMSGMMGGMMSGLSDKHSKKEIERLSSTNDALMAALDDAHANAPEGNMPDKVAAQNVGINHTQGDTSIVDPWAGKQAPPKAAPAPQMQGMQADPQQANMARSQNPAFNVNGGMPDLSALDEAYRRQGMGG